MTPDVEEEPKESREPQVRYISERDQTPSAVLCGDTAGLGDVVVELLVVIFILGGLHRQGSRTIHLFLDGPCRCINFL